MVTTLIYIIVEQSKYGNMEEKVFTQKGESSMDKNGLITLGEALIDFIPLDSENMIYQKSPGGAPANVAVGAARLGMKSAFIGSVGHDVLGEFIYETLMQYGVDVSCLALLDSYRTGLVFVTLDKAGERSFSFYIEDSADQFLKESAIQGNLFKENKIFHFGTISLVKDPAKSATKKAVSMAKENNMIISFDPNIRLSFWKNEELLKRTIFMMMNDVDVLKLSEEELIFLTGSDDKQSIRKWIEEYGLSIVFLTKGNLGSLVFIKDDRSAQIQAYPVSAVDTTGAGDAYVSALLYCLNERSKPLSAITLDEAIEIARFASVSGGLAASQKGAMTALPTLEQIYRELRNRE